MAADVVEVLNDRRSSRQTRVQTGQLVRPRQKLGRRDKRHLEQPSWEWQRAAVGGSWPASGLVNNKTDPGHRKKKKKRQRSWGTKERAGGHCALFPPQTLQPTTGGHWQSQGIQRTNQQLLTTLIILSFWMFSPFQHKPAQCKMRNKGETSGMQGHHLNFLGPDPPSLLPSSLPLPLQAAGPHQHCLVHFCLSPTDFSCSGMQTPPQWCLRPFSSSPPSGSSSGGLWTQRVVSDT